MSEPQALYVLIAPAGQLTGNGQLRETVKERRNRKGEDVPFWYLSPELVQKFDLPGTKVEAVVSEELSAINWLKLRFGGESCTAALDIDQLKEQAKDLPPAPNPKDISIRQK